MGVSETIKAPIKNKVVSMPEPDLLPIQVLAFDLGLSIEKIEAYLNTGQLVASIFCSNGAMQLAEVELENYGDMEWVVSSSNDPDFAIKGVYDIVSYSEIKWKYDKMTKERTADLNAYSIFLYKDNRYYSTACEYTINKNEIIVTKANVDRFKRHLDHSDIQCDDQVSTMVTPNDPVIEIEQRLDKTTGSVKPKSPPSVKDRKGFLKALILDGLQDFYETKKHMPEDGKALQAFLDFISSRINSKPRPQYIGQGVRVFNKSGLKERCIYGNETAISRKGYFRYYVETRFFTYRKESPYSIAEDLPAPPAEQ